MIPEKLSRIRRFPTFAGEVRVGGVFFPETMWVIFRHHGLE